MTATPLGRRNAPLLLFAASAVLACRLVLGLTLIPPWQQPDEPSHVAIAELQRARIALLDGFPDPARESEILYSMAKYDWWPHRGMETPLPIPVSFIFAGAKIGVNVTGITKPGTYYLILGRVLTWLPRMSVVKDLYVLRAISAALAVLTLWVAWLGASACLGATGGATVAVLMALHPQFAIVSTAAGPDAMVNLLGACVWWQAAVGMRRKNVLLPLAAVWLAAIGAAFSDRMAVPLLVVAVVVSVVVVSRRTPFRGWKALLVVPAAAICAGMIFGASIWAIDVLRNTYSLRLSLSGGWMPAPDAMNWDFLSRFSSFVLESWWFSLGWVRYAAPSWWTGFTVVLTAVATIGVGRRIFREHDGRTRALLGLAVMSLAVQLSAVYWAYFRFGNGAQGKSLFPCLVPCLVLLWAGLEALAPESRRRYAAVALVLVFALLDSAVWGLVAIPVYAN